MLSEEMIMEEKPKCILPPVDKETDLKQLSLDEELKRDRVINDCPKKSVNVDELIALLDL